MTSSDDHLLFLHAPDGVQWAKFLSSRLQAPDYGIKSVFREIKELPPAPPPPPPPPRRSPSERTPSLSSSSADTNNNDSNSNSNSNDVNNSCSGGQKITDADSKTDSNSTHCNNNNSSSSSNKNNNDDNKNESSDNSNKSGTKGSSSDHPSFAQSIADSRATVIFLSPEIIEDPCPFPLDAASLNPKSTVLLFLGVEIEEARTYFAADSDHVFKCRICLIDGREPSILDAMVQIIHAYEDCGSVFDEDDYQEENSNDIYHTPPQPVKKNHVEKVFPKVLSLGEREVYVLLSQECDEEPLAVLDETAMALELPLHRVCGRLFSLTLPKDLSGEISFKIEFQRHTFGNETVKILSELDQVREILLGELDPLVVLTKAIGLQASDVGGVDTSLAFRLQELAPAVTFTKMFPCEDALSSSGVDERSNSRWPSLLHFAADLNLRTLCSELLRYPGMLGAACTENRDGFYPSQLAARKGYAQLETDLLQFVQRCKTECEDLESEYVQPGLLTTGLDHRAQKSDVIVSHNASVKGRRSLAPQDSHPYVDMSDFAKSPLPVTHQHSDSKLTTASVKGNRSTGSDSVFRDDFDDGEENYMNVNELAREIASNRSPCPSPITDRRQPSDESSKQSSPRDPILSPLDSPGSTSRKALKMLGVGEEDIIRSRASTVEGSSTLRNPEPLDVPVYDPHFLSATTPPGFRLLAMPDVSDSRLSVSSNCEDPALYLSHEHQSKGAMVKKIKSFMAKIKGSKRSTTDLDASLSGQSSKKSISSGRSSTSSRSEAKRSSSRKNQLASDDSLERDSGSYSDEEKERNSPQVKRNKSKVFRESDKLMSRRMSRRAEQAKKEKIEFAPTLPSNPGKKRETFKSFIENP
ncbi:phosphoinositide 3-kinase adapter protein 1 [Aplysia californica]|uniref:Phosphoinositide 3-kinase adapter protein 1 n=1 Tax=Aplysia californica TaxID=6500 RepID=A0ABM0JJ97_APLCA|nr:phosphoinositide 3-kinase adapter protein 1 [Aplysia californica]